MVEQGFYSLFTHQKVDLHDDKKKKTTTTTTTTTTTKIAKETTVELR